MGCELQKCESIQVDDKQEHNFPFTYCVSFLDPLYRITYETVDLYKFIYQFGFSGLEDGLLGILITSQWMPKILTKQGLE